MRYQIVFDKPGRMRVRYGGYAFDKSLESRIQKLAVTNFFILSAEVHSANGGLLIIYKKGYRSQVISFIESLNFRSLTPLDEDNTTKEIDDNFKRGLLKLGVNHLVRRLFVPAPLRPLFVAYRAAGYILKGLSALAEGKLTVEVLDAASITACLAQRNFSTARTIMLLLSVSSLLEEYTHARTKAVLTSSLAIKADKVWLANGNEDVLIPIKELQVGDKIRVRTGCVIPVDGEITEGEAYINEASMTGESLAVMKSVNATVFAGTVLEEGSIVVKVRAVSSDTKIQKIIELIDSSENLKAGIQSRAERLADGIVPFSFLGFGLTLLLTGNITKAVSLLMVDYSCAIKLSTPISVISAIREAADRSITVKGGKYLEAFAAADTIVFDKTGTLTNAEPVLEKVIPFENYTEEEVLKTAACIEEHFPHSMARAIVKGAEQRGVLHAEEHAEVNYIVAHGIATNLHGERAIIGSRHFVCEDEGVTITDEQQAYINEKAGASSVIYLAVGGKLAGVLCINDPPRKEAARAVKLMKKCGIENVVMLTGDSSSAAEIIAKQLGITEFHAQVLPEEKHRHIEQLKADGHCVIMVGDGINDAPALAAADVSVAMSDASDIAKETADITLRGAGLTELAVMRKLSEQLMERINANYRFIVGFNTALLLLGFGGVISPSVSALLHNGSTMAICMKSMTSLLKAEDVTE
ncbi:MAG: heavy metal translocating P-type ATPase [Oscillospiraceae bacterium]|nr:heavy metal translocating P-type ATPase [Oscillospiraceae bacterium]MBQ8826028.1 heavy metal translocating P-type ATPase [Oscillospiraceae bacterium]